MSMGVYINGMEMPTTPVLFCVYPDGKVFADLEGNWRKYKAVPVPPHGRLIDADALLNRDADYEYPLFDTDGSWDCVVPCYDRETIKSAPTVIPAEGSKT